MKILYVSNGSNFFGAGGMEFHLLDISSWLNAHGVETAFAVRKGTYMERELLRGRPNVYALSWTGVKKLLSFFQLARVIQEYAPDIISINRERDIIRVMLISILVRPFLSKRPLLVSVFHNDGWNGGWLLSYLDGIIFPNRYLHSVYLPEGRKAKRTEIIYHGTALTHVNEPDKFRLDRPRKFFVGRGFPLIGMVGELRKNQTEMLDVAHFLRDRYPNLTLAFVGHGHPHEIEALKEKAEHLGLSGNVIITGGVDRKNISDIFFDLDLSLTTNRREPFGLVFIESLAAYTPVVAYDSGGPVEILEKGGGVLINGGPKEMAALVDELLTDHERRYTLAREGRSVVEKHFSMDTMGTRHEAYYRELLQDVDGCR